uniref:Terminase small subunit n=1 Tax=Ascaris lumbricoides TaxID=6252 RepID=A0A0M3HG51_ASCLU
MHFSRNVASKISGRGISATTVLGYAAPFNELVKQVLAEREEAEKAKIHARSKGRVEFLLKCPQQYDEILKTIDALSFEALPNYDQIYALLDKVCEQNQVMMNDRYDWEEETEISNGMLPSIGGIADTVLQKVDVSIRHKIDAHNKRNEKPVVRSKEALNV